MRHLHRLLILLVLLVGGCGDARRDTEINDRVKERFAVEKNPDAQLTFTTQDRIVRIDGVVRNERERQRIDRTAREVNGVLAVDNRLVVQAPVETTGAGVPPPSPTPVR